MGKKSESKENIKASENAMNDDENVFDMTIVEHEKRDNSFLFKSPRTSPRQVQAKVPEIEILQRPCPEDEDRPEVEKLETKNRKRRIERRQAELESKRRKRKDSNHRDNRECEWKSTPFRNIPSRRRRTPFTQRVQDSDKNNYCDPPTRISTRDQDRNYDVKNENQDLGVHSRLSNKPFFGSSAFSTNSFHGSRSEKRLQQSRALIRSSSYYFGPQRSRKKGSLRPIIIDGSNVAMGHGNNKVFSCRGIKLCVEYFFGRGHEQIVVFVPQYRHKRSESKDTYILDILLRWNVLKFTPSREIGGYRYVSYDDRYILQYANDVGGIIISNDQYRDLHEENPHWRNTIDKRVLGFTWPEEDYLMFPQDPFGRHGPSLDELLQF